MNIKQRSSNFELLRIICMIMIILFHAAYKGNFNEGSGIVDNVVLKSFWFLGELGVNVFIMISGYFMVNGRFRLKKMVLILFEAFFYNTISVLVTINLKECTIIQLFEKLFHLNYWFITCYLIIYALSPFLNRFIKIISQKVHFELLCVLLIINSVIPTAMGLLSGSSESFSFYNRTIWYIVIYLFAAYVRLYGFSFLNSLKSSVAVFAVSFASMLASMFLFYFIDKSSGFDIEPAFFWTPNSVLMFIASAGLFGIGKNIIIPNNKVINRIASTTLGIYLIHDGLLNRILWPTVRNIQIIRDARYSFVYVIIACAVIFAVCCVIDLLRQVVEKYTVKKVLDSQTVLKIFLKAKGKLIQLESKILK